MDEQGPFDRRLRRLRRDRAASIGGADPFGGLIDEELIERLDLVTRTFNEALVLGCGRSGVPQLLRARGMAVVAADAGLRFAARSGGIQCDEDRLPFADAAFDLVIAPGSLDSVNDLPGALTLIRRTLRPDGLFLAAFPGAGSLPHLKHALLTAELETSGAASPRIHPQIDVRSAGDLLMRAGFRLPVVDAQPLTLRYAELERLIADLRMAGATNILAGGERPLGRAALAIAHASFAAQADADGKVSERIEIIHLSAWAPSPDQPRPAARGSGRQSLADALRPPSQPD